MRGLVVILLLTVVAYVIWQLLPKEVRTDFLKTVGHHGPRLGALIIAILGIALMVYILPAFNILF